MNCLHSNMFRRSTIQMMSQVKWLSTGVGNNQSPSTSIQTDGDYHQKVRTMRGQDRKMTPITDFYANKNIFITGTSGFVGKVLLEKLLRSCNDVGMVYLLLRDKKGLSAQKRFHQIINSPLFEKLFYLYPDILKKVVVLPGDVNEAYLGMTAQDYEAVVNNVDIVINGAADIRMVQPVAEALKSNVLSLQNVIKMCRSMPHLEVFMHVSTMYSRCSNVNPGKVIDEQVESVDMLLPKNITDFSSLEENIDNFDATRIANQYPTFYGYSKGVAEQFLLKEAGDLPLLIFRPSVVTASLKDPFPGWIDNFGNMSGLIAGIGSGMLRTLPGNRDLNINITPVDLVVRCMLASIWHFSENNLNQPKIVQYGSNRLHPAPLRLLESVTVPTLTANPVRKRFRSPKFAFVKTELEYDIHRFFKHIVPAIIADTALKLSSKEPSLVKRYQLIHKSIEGIKFYMNSNWDWTTNNAEQILHDLATEDRANFDFDVQAIDWEGYYKDFSLGVKKYVLKDSNERRPEQLVLKNTDSHRKQLVNNTTGNRTYNY